MGVLGDIGRFAGGAAEGLERGQRIAASQQATNAAFQKAQREQEAYDQAQDAAAAKAVLLASPDVDEDFDVQAAVRDAFKGVTTQRSERQRAAYEASPVGKMRGVVSKVLGRDDVRKVADANKVGLPMTPGAQLAKPSIQIAASEPDPTEMGSVAAAADPTEMGSAAAETPAAKRRRAMTDRERAFIEMAISGQYKQPEFTKASEAYFEKTFDETANSLNRLNAAALSDKLNDMGRADGTTFAVTPNKVEPGKAPTFTLSMNGEVQRENATVAERGAWIRGLVKGNDAASVPIMNAIHDEELGRKSVAQQLRMREAQEKELERKIKRTIELEGRADAADERQLAEVRQKKFDETYMSDPENFYDRPNDAAGVVQRMSMSDPKRENRFIWETTPKVTLPDGTETGGEVVNKLERQAQAALKYRREFPQRAMIQERELPDGRRMYAVLDVNGNPIRETISPHWRQAAERATALYGDKPMTPKAPGMPTKPGAAPGAAAPGAAPTPTPAPTPAPRPRPQGRFGGDANQRPSGPVVFSSGMRVDASKVRPELIPPGFMAVPLAANRTQPAGQMQIVPATGPRGTTITIPKGAILGPKPTPGLGRSR